jgi:hypothetical protein
MNAIRKLDALLRGEATTLPHLREGRLDVPVVGLSVVLSTLGMIYGACMGLFAITGNGSGSGMQILAASVKVPLLFVLTLLVTFPSLYVFNALFGSRLRLVPMLQLMIGSIAVALAVLSSIGPITAFFGVSSTSYAFMVLLNVVVFAVAGGLGLVFLLQTLHRMTVIQEIEVAGPPPLDRPEGVADAEFVPSAVARSTAEPIRGGVWMIFQTWVLVFGLVGMQMAWLLRPFIGTPDKPFEWFRPRGGNFFEAVYTQATKLFG